MIARTMLTTSNYKQCVGAAIRALRKEKDLTQMDLAVGCQLTRSYITGVEGGKRKVSLENLVKIAGVLDVSLSVLLEKAETLSKA